MNKEDILELIVANKLKIEPSRNLTANEMEEMNEFLNSNNYLCQNKPQNPILVGQLYVNELFCHDNLSKIKERWGESASRIIEVDCIVNHSTDELISGIFGLDEEIEELADRLSSISDDEVMSYYHSIDQQHAASSRLSGPYIERFHPLELEEINDQFAMAKTRVLRQFFIERMVQVFRGGRYEPEGEFSILVGNGFTTEIAKDRANFQMRTIYRRAYELESKLNCGSHDLLDELDKAIELANDIISSENEDEVTRKIWGWPLVEPFQKITEIFNDYNEANRRGTLNKLVISQCREYVFSKGESQWRSSYRLDLEEMSFEDAMAIWQALNEPSYPWSIDEKLKFIEKKKRFYSYLGKSIFNDGKAADPGEIDPERVDKHGFDRMRCISCFTTNYDTYTDFIFPCPVLHLHGSFNRFLDQNGVTQVSVRDAPSILDRYARNERFHIVIDVEMKAGESVYFEKEFKLLEECKGTLVIFGFSGSFDSHITNVLKQNENIKLVVFCVYGLEKWLKRKDVNSLKQYIAMKYTRFNKKILIVNSDLLIC